MTALLWIVVTILCAGLEIATSGFWFIWFGISGFLVTILAFFGFCSSFTIQCLIFALCSLVLVIFTRPLVTKFIRVKERHSNTEALIGRLGIVISPISPVQFGQVKVNGEIWTATSDSELSEGQRIKVTAIDGVKLQVVAENPL